MLNFLVVAAAITQILVGLVVFRKGRNNLTHILFGIISLVTLAWALTNYLYTLDPTSDTALTVIRFVMFFVVLQNTVFYVFANNYPSAKLAIQRKSLILFLTFSAIVAAATLSPFVFASATVSSGQTNPNPGPLIPIFLTHAIYSIVSGLHALIVKMHLSAGQQKKQLQFILSASVLIWVVVPITNFAITLALHTTFFAKVSPLYTLMFGGIIAYAIIAQRLFNIQAAVARSVAYSLTFVTIASIYVLTAFILPAYLFDLQTVSTKLQFAYAVLALLLAFSLNRIRKTFDKLSNRIFYQDAYEPQELYNKLNRVLVATVDLDQLVSRTLNLVETNIKIEYAAATIFDPVAKVPRIVGTEKSVVHAKPFISSNPCRLGAGTKDTVIVADAISPDNVELTRLFSENNVAVLARLRSGPKSKEHDLGYLLIGPKRSGNAYSSQDLKVIEIIANELVLAVQNALRFEEIERFNETLQQKVADATRKLKESNEKLKMLNEAKDDFIGMASHQLRTPLTSVKGYLSLVIDGDAGRITATQKKLLTQAFVSSQRMVYLIADLLNVSRLRTGKFIIERTPTDIVAMINEEIGQLREVATARGVQIFYEPPQTFPVLPLDETKTRQVVMNFIDNAIYYTPSGGTVHLQLRELAKSIELRVVDDGIGVPKADQYHLFTKFYRAKNAQRARPDGTGLGLFMAKKVIAAMGGAIIFSSTEGKGSTFGFSFPKDLPHENTVVEAGTSL